MVGDRLLVFGGRKGVNKENSDRLFECRIHLETATFEWLKPQLSWDSRQCMFVVRQYTEQVFNSFGIVFKFSINRYVAMCVLYVRKIKGTFTERENHASSLVGTSKLFVFGGYGETQLNDLHLLNIGQPSTPTSA